MHAGALLETWAEHAHDSLPAADWVFFQGKPKSWFASTCHPGVGSGYSWALRLGSTALRTNTSVIKLWPQSSRRFHLRFCLSPEDSAAWTCTSSIPEAMKVLGRRPNHPTVRGTATYRDLPVTRHTHLPRTYKC